MRVGVARERLAGFGSLALIGAVAAAALWSTRPPRPLPADAAPERFSAGRAMADVRHVAVAPRPLGSAAHAAARDYLFDRMSALGLSPEVQELTVARRRSAGHIVAARVRNLVGRFPGRGGGGTTLLVAHYDSRPNTPGAGDDAAGVAVVLEVVRALGSGPDLEDDLIVLLADGEELGLLGAAGFADRHQWMNEVTRVLNFEARGSRGPVQMFETGVGDLALVRALAAASPQPLASSLSAAVYARMPNDTDFSVFRDRGLSGLNFAFVGGLAAYHTALDTGERLDPASLQHAGANALALLRALDGRDGAPPAAEGTWFNPLGGALLVLSRVTVRWVVGALALLTFGALAVGARREGLAARAVAAATVSALLVLASMPLSAAVVWRLFVDNAPGLLDTPHRLPHRLELAGCALFLAGVAVASSLAALARPRRPAEIALGVAALLALSAVTVSFVLPGAAFLFWWPLPGLLGAVVAVVAFDPPAAKAVLWLSIGAVPGTALLAPLSVFVFQALTPSLAVAALALPALLLVLALPALTAAVAERQGWALGAFLGALTLLAAAGWGQDEGRPRTVDLVHLEELDTGTAFRLSRDDRPDPWTLDQLGGAPREWQSSSLPGFLAGASLRGESWTATAPGPVAEEVEDERIDGRRVRLRLRSPAGAPMVRLEVRSTVQITAVEVAGERFERGMAEAGGPLRLELAGLAPEGLDVVFHLPDRWPLELALSEQFYGLPEVAPLPQGRIPDLSWTSHSRIVHRSLLR